jgi:NADP-dependent 3-hydroxy acid dehydrogenase YdfG
MKIAITGYSRGIGKALYDGFKSQGHEVLGFNRSTVANISTDAGIDRIVETAKDCDIFINNAWDQQRSKTLQGFSQTVLLYKMWEQWQGQDKTIIVIGSRAADGVYNSSFRYAVQKKTLDSAIAQLRNCNIVKPYILNLRPGWTDTDAVADNKTVNKMDPKYVFEVCNWALKQPHLIFDITFAPRQDR